VTVLKPSLLYILFNTRQVSAERLLWALHYQYGRPWTGSLTYSQILIAFNDLSPKKLTDLRETYGNLDEEPLAHLLLDQGFITHEQFLTIQTLRPAFGQTYIGDLLVKQAGVLRRQLEAVLFSPLLSAPLTPAGEILARRQAIKQFTQRLWQRGYFQAADLNALGIDRLEYVSRSFKPLADLLVLNGDLPEHLLPLLFNQAIQREAEPLLPLLSCAGYEPDTLLKALDARSEPGDQHRNLALLLAEKNLISRRRLTDLILVTYRAVLPSEQTVA